MSNRLINDTFYKQWKAVIDPAAFIATGMIGFEKLRSLEWINGPITQQSMAVSGALNGLAVYLSYRIGKGDESESSYYQVMLTLIGFAIGTIAAPYVVSKILKMQAVLITPQMAFRMTALHLVTKVFVYAAFTIGEKYYGSWNFPAFQKFEDMTPHAIKVLYNSFKDHPEMWNREPFKKQLGFNRVLMEHKFENLNITAIDLNASLTKYELETFRKLYENGPLTTEQATLLYNSHVPPQERRAYQIDNLPMLDPRKVQVDDLSDAQIRWHYEWIIAHPSLTMPQAQIQAFVPHFYRLDLLPPYETFIAELPFPPSKEGLSSAKISYLAHFYKIKQYKWDHLLLDQQIFLREIFDQHGFESHPLREPTIDQMESLKYEYIREYKEWFEKEATQWDLKPRNYQEAFNKVLKNHSLDPLDFTTQPWSTTKKVAIIGGIALAIVGLIVVPTALVLMNRTVPFNNTLEDKHESDTQEQPSTLNSTENSSQLIELIRQQKQSGEITSDASLSTQYNGAAINRTPCESKEVDLTNPIFETEVNSLQVSRNSSTYVERENQCHLVADAVYSWADNFFDAPLPSNKKVVLQQETTPYINSSLLERDVHSLNEVSKQITSKSDEDKTARSSNSHCIENETKQVLVSKKEEKGDEADTSFVDSLTTLQTRKEEVIVEETQGVKEQASFYPLWGWLALGLFGLAPLLYRYVNRKKEAGEQESLPPTIITVKPLISQCSSSEDCVENKLETLEKEQFNPHKIVPESSNSISIIVSPPSPSKREQLQKQLSPMQRGQSQGQSAASSESLPSEPPVERSSKSVAKKLDFQEIETSPTMNSTPKKTVTFNVDQGKKEDFKDVLKQVLSIGPVTLGNIDTVKSLQPYVIIPLPKQPLVLDYRAKESTQYSIESSRFLGARITCMELEKGSYYQLLDEFISNKHQFYYLEIDAARISGDRETHLADAEVIDKIIGCDVNRNIRMLTLSGFEKITKDQLNKVAQKFPNVVYFDLRGSGVDPELIEGFKNNYILITDKFENVGTHFNHYRQKIEECRENFKRGELGAFNAIFDPNADLEANRYRHPLGPYRYFVENISFLSELGIDDDFIQDKVVPYLKSNFPNARALDLSGCGNLTSAATKVFSKKKFRIESLILKDCQKLSGRFRSGESGLARPFVYDSNAAATIAFGFGEMQRYIGYLDLRGSVKINPLILEKKDRYAEVQAKAKEIALAKKSEEKSWFNYVRDALKELYPQLASSSKGWDDKVKMFWHSAMMTNFHTAVRNKSVQLRTVVLNLEGREDDLEFSSVGNCS